MAECRKVAELMETAIFATLDKPNEARDAKSASHPARRLAAVRRRIRGAA